MKRKKKTVILILSIIIVVFVAAFTIIYVKFIHTTDCDNFTFNRVLQTALELENPSSVRIISGHCEHGEYDGQRVGVVMAKIRYEDSRGKEKVARYMIVRGFDGEFAYLNCDELMDYMYLIRMFGLTDYDGTDDIDDFSMLFEKNNVNIFMINNWLSNYWNSNS